MAAASGPLVQLERAADGQPEGAVAAGRIAAPPGRVFAVAADLEGYAGRVPTIHEARRRGDLVAIRVRFKLALLTFRFGFDATVAREEGRVVEVRWVSGEPHGIHMRFEVVPLEDPRASVLYVGVGYDVRSLGWLAQFFLRHHPEIELGAFAGTALTLVESLRRAAESP